MRAAYYGGCLPSTSVQLLIRPMHSFFHPPKRSMHVSIYQIMTIFHPLFVSRRCSASVAPGTRWHGRKFWSSSSACPEGVEPYQHMANLIVANEFDVAVRYFHGLPRAMQREEVRRLREHLGKLLTPIRCWNLGVADVSVCTGNTR